MDNAAKDVAAASFYGTWLVGDAEESPHRWYGSDATHKAWHDVKGNPALRLLVMPRLVPGIHGAAGSGVAGD